MRYSMFFFFKQKTAYEMRISDWSSDVCSSDLGVGGPDVEGQGFAERDLVAVDPGAHLRLRGETGSEQQQAGQRRVPAWHQRSQIGRASCRDSVCQSV